MLEVGSKAPDFTLNDKDGNAVSLSDFHDKKVVVYFYSKNNTPGSIRQARAFKDAYASFKSNQIAIIGISRDSEKSHRNFSVKYELPFILLSNPDLTVIQAYGVWQEKKIYGKAYMGVARATFVIDETGDIIKVFPKAKPDTNAAEILKFIDNYPSA
ncbi:MAG: thioredoxin-dependent thiol peroxidase [Lutispora sp.]|nr:thioredoxin-dependent thiol peroxidase [Lutispora sp.]MDD4833456.1 thioredoxin-dependent thiol peroxidase [Lutispora sp.]